ncbi:MAG: nodulation protein NfeD [Chloroflexi bacterium]|nr:nodulation protein NfeD [Chloroflexota bacterium]
MNKSRFLSILRPLFLMIVGILLLLSPQPAAAQSETGRPQVVVLEANGAIFGPFASYIERGISEAERIEAEALIIQLDTPGGELQTTDAIVGAMQTSRVPIVVFVGPRGAQAGSAGLLVTLAGHVSVMAPQTNIGASSVISGSGAELDSTLADKINESNAALGRSLAEGRPDEAIDQINAAFLEAAAYSSQEAFESGLVDYMAEDINDVLEVVDGHTVRLLGDEVTLNTRDAGIVPVEQTFFEVFMIFIANPTLASIFLSLGFFGLVAEVRTPGVGIPGILGLVFFSLGLFGIGLLPVNWLGMVFVVLAIGLFLAELFTPTLGALAIGGAISLAAGLWILFANPEVQAFGPISPWAIVGQSVLIAAIFLVYAVMIVQTMREQPRTGSEGLLGQTARVTLDLEPEGSVLLMGERWKAIAADGHTIPAGADVEIVEVKGLTVIVQEPEKALAQSPTPTLSPK